MSIARNRITTEMCRREAVVLLWNALGIHAGVDQVTRFIAPYDPIIDRIWLRLDYKSDTAVLDVEHTFFEQSMDEVSKVIYSMVAVLQSVQIARRRQFKLRKMKARSRARTWRMPWLRRRNIWIGV